MSERYRLDAVSILNRFYQRKICFLEEGYNGFFARRLYSPRERSLLVSVVRGTVKTKAHLEGILRGHLPKWERLPLAIQNLLRLALFQMIFHSGIPVFATVHEWVEVTKSLPNREFVPLVNAVLRKVGEEIPNYREKALEWGMILPDWIEEEWKALFPEDQAEIKRSLMLPPETHVRVNTLRIGKDALRKRLEHYGMLVEEIPGLPFTLRVEGESSVLFTIPEWQEGLFYLQDVGSQVVTMLCNPSAGERIVDLCCGVGGKSTAFAQLMGDRGEIFAWDWDSKKIEVLRHFISRMGIKSIVPAVVDGFKPPEEFLESADRVFLDAPCSGLGTLRRHPEVLERTDQNTVRALAEKQLNLLLSASRLVKRGGIILYCVCALSMEETEGVVRKFEEQMRGEFERISERVMDGEGTAFSHFSLVSDGGIFILPHRMRNDGFFVAIWKKK
ncbi:MAG: transcription antitermination factor NusB [Atribacterota bacterium]